ncbi:hypothetical protein ACFYPT_37895 [Streptomyces sp. NPDC005529]|uniref:hypothetical protein n=1 Tax=unclassified Streptomyces TaxID=2593676 RepID=UPI0033BF5DE3
MEDLTPPPTMLTPAERRAVTDGNITETMRLLKKRGSTFFINQQESFQRTLQDWEDAALKLQASASPEQIREAAYAAVKTADAVSADEVVEKIANRNEASLDEANKILEAALNEISQTEVADRKEAPAQGINWGAEIMQFTGALIAAILFLTIVFLRDLHASLDPAVSAHVLLDLSRIR